MTPAERALLLAVAMAHIRALGPWNSPIYELIDAVEAEAEPKPKENPMREWDDVIREWHDDHRT